MKTKLDRIYQSSFFKFLLKYNLFYLLLPILIYFIMWGCYSLALVINHNEVYLDFEVDKHIPYIKYFVVLYLTYYFMPELLLWRISFKDKKKYWVYLLTMCVTNLLCYIFYCFYSVKVIREPSVDMNMSILDIRSFDNIFDYLVSFVYQIDKDALNSLPSIHASTGLLMLLMALPKKGWRLNLGLTITGSICGIGCIISTLFIKQHYLIDVVVGIILGLLVYFVIVLIGKYVKKEEKLA